MTVHLSVIRCFTKHFLFFAGRLLIAVDNCLAGWKCGE